MTVKNLYKIVRPDGGVTVSAEMPAGMAYTLMYRLIADEGYTLTDGTRETPCVDTETPESWTEIPDQPEATEQDYQQALGVFGVEVPGDAER